MATTKRGVAARRKAKGKGIKRGGREERSRRAVVAPKRRGKAAQKRRTGSSARRAPRKAPAKKFTARERIYHLIDPAAFVRTTDAEGFEHLGPAPDARTTCCDRPVADVYATATSRTAFDPQVDNWCAGVPA